MKKKDPEAVILWMLVGAALIILTICIVVTVIPHERTDKGQRYDLECVAGRSRNPLEECKE